jgi:hypothetical protein
MFEVIGFYFLAFAAGLMVIGLIWLLVAAFRVSWKWGVPSLLFPPLLLVFIFRHWKKSLLPVFVLLVALLIGAAPFAVNYYETRFVDLGPRQKMVAGELHVTLTGWDRSDYSVLDKLPEVVVLQMATNGDVNDETLTHLRNLKKLRELDLNDTAVTDAGLVVLAELPTLESLRLARTKITDDGFRKYLLPLTGLRELDLTGTGVKSKTIREWKAAGANRKVVQ